MYQRIDNQRAHSPVLRCTMTQMQQLTALPSLLGVSAALQATTSIYDVHMHMQANGKKQQALSQCRHLCRQLYRKLPLASCEIARDPQCRNINNQQGESVENT